MLNTCSDRYPIDRAFTLEAHQVGGGSYFLGPYKALRFSSELLSERDMELFSQRRNGDDTTMLRQQKNATKNLYCVVLGMTRSCNAMLLTEIRDLPREQGIQRVRDAAECIKAAMTKTYEETIRNVTVGRGAQRKIVEQGERLAVLSIHGMNNQGQLHGHGHMFFHGCGYLESQKRSYSVADARDVYRIQDVITERFHKHLESELSNRMKWSTSIDQNGHAVAYGYDQKIYESMTGGGRERIEQYLKEQNLPSTNVTRAYAALNVRGNAERPFYDLGTSVEQWKQQAIELKQSYTFEDGDKKLPPQGQEAPKEDRQERETKRKAPSPEVVLDAKARLERFLKVGLGPVHRAVEVSFNRGKALVHVRDVDRFLLDVKKQPRMDANRSAFQAMKKTAWLSQSPAETLEIGKRAFKEARKPRIELKQGDKLLLSKKAIKHLTPDQERALMRLVMKHDLKINLPEQLTRKEHLRLQQLAQEKKLKQLAHELYR